MKRFSKPIIESTPDFLDVVNLLPWDADRKQRLVEYVEAHISREVRARAYSLLVSVQNYRQINAKLESDKVILMQELRALEQQLVLLQQRLELATKADEEDTAQL